MIKLNLEAPVDFKLPLTSNPDDPSIIGQLVQNLDIDDPDDPDPCVCTGLGREVDFGIYEGQYHEDEWNGFGRRIIANGDYYVGYWKEGMRNGWGRYVYCNIHKKSSGVQNSNEQNLILIEEGEWVDDEFKGEAKKVTPQELQDIISKGY